MKKTFYDVLQVSKWADQHIIDVAYQSLLNKHQSNEDHESRNQLQFIRHAYEVLGNSDQRKLYDQKLKSEEYSSELEPQSELKNDFESGLNIWWKSPKVSWIIIASVALIGFSLYTGHIGEKNKVEIVKQVELTKRESNELDAANDSKHLDNEEVLVKGVVQNQDHYISEASKIDNRALDIARQAEERKRIEIESRANADAQRLYIQRREQEARLASQQLQQENYRKNMEQQNAERSKRFYACLHNALDGGYDRVQAEGMCPR